jgi:hypothetical protein
VSRVSLPFDASLALIEPGSSGGYTNAGTAGANPAISVYCFPWGFRVHVDFGYRRSLTPDYVWNASYELDVLVESCAEGTWPRDLTVPLVSVNTDTDPTYSPPSSVRVILSDPNDAADPTHADCCYYTEPDFLCSRLISALPAAVSVALTTTVGSGPDPFASGPYYCPLVGVVTGTNYCWTAVYQSVDEVVWSCPGCDLVSYVRVQVDGNFFPHRYSPASLPPPGTALVSVSGELAIRTTGEGGCGITQLVAPPFITYGSVTRYRAPCENFAGGAARVEGFWSFTAGNPCDAQAFTGWVDTFTVTEL